jgi:hypothetical protein
MILTTYKCAELLFDVIASATTNRPSTHLRKINHQEGINVSHPPAKIGFQKYLLFFEADSFQPMPRHKSPFLESTFRLT